MKLTHFEIDSIGPMFRSLTPPFARCDVEMKVKDADVRANNVIKLDLVVTYRASETVDELQAKILAEALRVLEAAASLLRGKDIQALHAMADAEDQILKSEL